MVSLILCSHSDLCQSLKRTAEMIYGEVENCETVSLLPDGSLEGIAAEIREKYDAFHAQGDDVVCLCDLSNASPFNACCIALGDTDARVIPGMSLPLLITIASGRDEATPETLDDFLRECISDSKDAMDLIVVKDLMAEDAE